MMTLEQFTMLAVIAQQYDVRYSGHRVAFDTDKQCVTVYYTDPILANGCFDYERVVYALFTVSMQAMPIVTFSETDEYKKLLAKKQTAEFDKRIQKLDKLLGDPTCLVYVQKPDGQLRQIDLICRVHDSWFADYTQDGFDTKTAITNAFLDSVVVYRKEDISV